MPEDVVKIAPSIGRVIGMHTFGASAPLKDLQKRFGFEPDQVVAVVKDLLKEHSEKPCADRRSVPVA